jgi:hypothetical protein
MPVSSQLTCPGCGAPLIRKPGGCCPSCGADVREHVLQERRREVRIERVVAVVSTILVLGVSLFAGGCSVVEGVIAYAIAGAAMWIIAKRTFYES